MSSNYAKKVLLTEAKAIEKLADLIDENFDHAVKTILEMPQGGRIVISGMGKASFIAMKFSATLASIGVPSFFLHPSEAVHGDLGRYTKNDISIILSNSGETPEILRMLPHIKEIGCPLISITSSKDSNLAKHSDIVLRIGKQDEVGPLGLAPTTSTTVMLALGDALAMALLNSKEFSLKDFARFHPGGDLGRSLTLVSEIMRTGEENCIVPQTMKTREVIHAISATKGRPGAACVADNKGKLFGIFTDGNLRRCLEEHADFLDHPVSDFATKNPKVIHKDKLVQEALRVMTETKIDQIIVTDDDKSILGLIDIQDLVKF
jgi:arabinose-5-phosphate isomerase